MDPLKWLRLKKLTPTTWAAPKDVNSAHYLSLGGDPVEIKKPRWRLFGKRAKGAEIPSQHQRIVADRARRLNMSVEEYKRQFGG